jgi:hypothetical protein
VGQEKIIKIFMSTLKLRQQLIVLFKMLSPEELIDFLLEKHAFQEEFLELILDSVFLKKCVSNPQEDYNYDFKDVKNKLSNYEVGYDKKNKKFTVNIKPQEVFSYYDSESDLKEKLKKYISKEEYEKAEIITKYIKCI